MNKFLLIFGLVVLFGCSTISVRPDGSVRALAIGQASAEHCPAATDEEVEKPGCTVAEGGSFSDGFIGALKDIVKIPFAMLAGAAAGVAGQ